MASRDQQTLRAGSCKNGFLSDRANKIFPRYTEHLPAALTERFLYDTNLFIMADLLLRSRHYLLHAWDSYDLVECSRDKNFEDLCSLRKGSFIFDEKSRLEISNRIFKNTPLPDTIGPDVRKTAASPHLLFPPCPAIFLPFFSILAPFSSSLIPAARVGRHRFLVLRFLRFVVVNASLNTSMLAL